MTTERTTTVSDLLTHYRQTGDYEPFASAVENICRAVFARAGVSPDDRDDLMQETHIKVWQAIETLDASRPVVCYLRSIAANVVKDSLKAARAKKRDAGYIDYLISLPAKKVEQFFN